MSHGLLEILKYFLLALLWMFFIYAARMVLVEVRRSRSASSSGAAPTSQPAESPLRLRVVEPTKMRGQTFDLLDELTLGRSAACMISLDDDSYASSVHARVYKRDGEAWVEDLGSTNGTYLNDRRLAGPARIQRGDKVTVGSTVFEVRR